MLLKEQLERLKERYLEWMNQDVICRFTRQGGRVFVATENVPGFFIEKLLSLGHRHFAEKFVQESMAKWSDFRKQFPDITLHQYGHLQTNKVLKALDCYEGLESLDSFRLAEAIAKRRSSHHRLNDFWLQVNLAQEPQKTGIYPDHASLLIHECQNRLKIPINGVMAIPPKNQCPIVYFKQLKKIAEAHQLQDCIMGMTQDYEVAIEMGSTAIRIKRALFGSFLTP